MKNSGRKMEVRIVNCGEEPGVDVESLPFIKRIILRCSTCVKDRTANKRYHI